MSWFKKGVVNIYLKVFGKYIKEFEFIYLFHWNMSKKLFSYFSISYMFILMAEKFENFLME